MSRLLAANFARLKKSHAFLAEIIFMILLGIYEPVVRYFTMKQSGETIPLDNGFFLCVALILILAAVLCSLYVGTEYSDGTIRNKVVVGRRRPAIYLANLITCALADTFLCLLYFAAYLCVGLPLLGPFQAVPPQVAYYILCTVLLAIAASAIFTLAAMLIQNKAATVAVCLLGAFALLLAGSYIDSRLSEPETYPSYSLITDGEVINEGEEPNSHYLRGTKRKVYEFFYDFLPGGQAVQITSWTVARPWNPPLYAVIITVAATGCGVYAFNKKDLK
ncbi:MAG TPA: ABC transporter permease [Lachnospiraceae bacterium]|nr:ABC transporter permease [Lachnospiraceae bacterium]